MIKVLICGACGKMGANLIELLASDCEAAAICGVDMSGDKCAIPVYPSFDKAEDKVDVIIDFSSPAVLDGELEYAKAHRVPLVIASTGFTQEQLDSIAEAAKSIAVFRTANFSLGVNLICELVKKAAQTLGDGFDIEIIEKHHNKKADAPSGTAIMLAESANCAFGKSKPYLYGRSGLIGKRGNEIAIHAVRGGTIVGEHEVDFCGEDEIITVTHSARSRKVFAAGAIKAAKWIIGKDAGLYDMKDMLKEI